MKLRNLQFIAVILPDSLLDALLDGATRDRQTHHRHHNHDSHGD